MLRLDGPLGLSGTAIQIVSTCNFEAACAASTNSKLQVHGSREMEENIPGIVEQVGEHFKFERFKPYIESGKHLN